MVVAALLAPLLTRTDVPKNVTLGDKLYRLRALSPDDYRDLERLVDWKLKLLLVRLAHDRH